MCARGAIGSRLDEHHRTIGVLGQARGEDTTSGTSTDDDDVMAHRRTLAGHRTDSTRCSLVLTRGLPNRESPM